MSLINEVSAGLRLSESFLERMARTATHRYKVYFVPKRSGAGSRKIEHPSRELKAIQRFLNWHVVAKLAVHPNAYAYRSGHAFGVAANARRHADRAFLLRMDFADFFPSIASSDIDRFLVGAMPSWTAADREFFVLLVTRGGALTVGAPTSPGLSNAMCIELDTKLTALAVGRGLSYTRYADDLFFSTSARDVLRFVPDEVTTILGQLTTPRVLTINPAKTVNISRKNRRSVTGLVLTSQGGISLGRSKKRELSAGVHQFDQLSAVAKLRLAGWLAYCSDVEPDFINRLAIKYGVSRVAAARRGA